MKDTIRISIVLVVGAGLGGVVMVQKLQELRPDVKVIMIREKLFRLYWTDHQSRPRHVRHDGRGRR